MKTFQQIFAHAGKLSMRRQQSSQLPPPHHHTSEHSNFWTIILHGSHRSIGQTTHCQKPGPIFCSAHTEQKTSTRIQTHQNLFTLTKNSFVPPKQLDWEQHPISRFPTFTGTTTKKPKLDFPHNISKPPSNPTWWRWTESNRRPPACKAGALPIELHPQPKVFSRQCSERLSDD